MKNPNILVIYTDQQRYDTLGINGNPLIRTPNLDRFGRQGVNFHNAHVSCPLCVPSRVGFFTGRHTHATRSYHNVIPLGDGERDFVALLRDRGYTTALIGKDHCFGRGRDRTTFDYLSRAGHTCFLPPRNRREREINEIHGGDAMWKPYLRHDIQPDEDVSGKLCLEACDYIGVKHDREFGQPFFLWLSLPEPHAPHMAPEPYVRLYDGVDIPPPVEREGEMDDKPARQRIAARSKYYDVVHRPEVLRMVRQVYWASCTYIDDYVGRVLKALDEAGIADETIVVFTSDHGDHLGDHHLLRKGITLYDCLTKVPLIVRAPGVRPAETRALVSNLDVMPTVLDLAGVAPDRPHHGRSFRGLLEGRTDVHRDALLLEYGYPGAPLREEDLTAGQLAELTSETSFGERKELNAGRSKAVRTDRWKLVVTPGDVDELYDLQNDPHELTNLAGRPEHAALRARLARRILEELIVMQDEIPPERLEELQASKWWN